MTIINRFFTALAVIAFVVAPRICEADTVYTDNIVVVIDDSGSMQEGFHGQSRMEAAKHALRAVLETVPKTTFIGILTLNNGWYYDLGPRDDTRLTAAIVRLRPAAGTPLGEKIKEGTDRLLEQRRTQFGYGTYRLLVITDGIANDEALMNRWAADTVRRGITLDAIGVGMAAEHPLAKRASSYRAANDAVALQKAIRSVLVESYQRGETGSSNEDLALIAPLPDNVAAAVVQSLTILQNHPLGTTPPQPPSPSSGGQPSGGGPAAPTGGSADCNGGKGCNHAPGVMFVFVALYLVRPTRKRRRFE